MKKNILYLIIGAALIVLVFIADAVTAKVMDFSDPSNFEIGHYILFAVATIMLVSGIVFIVKGIKLSRNKKIKECRK